jgi:hypothetical protein
VCDACGESSAAGARFWVSKSDDPNSLDDPTPWELCFVCHGLFNEGATERLVRDRVLPKLLATLSPKQRSFAKQTMLSTWTDLLRRVERTEMLPS